MTPRLSWRDPVHTLRDWLLASPRFQHWAAAFPFTRGVARRRARGLFDLCAGFVYSQVLLACVRLKVFGVLADGKQSVADLAPRLGLSQDATHRLLAAAASLGLVRRRGAEQYGLGDHGAALLANPGISAMIEHHALLYADLADPVALLRGEAGESALGRFWAYARADQPSEARADQVDAYSRLMAVTQPMIAAEVLDAYPLQRHRCLLDVGGGEGRFLAEAGARVPGLTLMLFDLPAVVDRARAHLASVGLDGRTQCVGGSFLTDALPKGPDVVSLVRVVHDHDDESVMALLRAAHTCLPPGGTLLLAEPMAETPGAEPIGDAYFGFYLLAMGRGRPRPVPALTQMLTEAGFVSVRLRPTHTPMLTSLLIARTPGKPPEEDATKV